MTGYCAFEFRRRSVPHRSIRREEVAGLPNGLGERKNQQPHVGCYDGITERRRFVELVMLFAILLTGTLRAAPTADFSRAFEDANRLYEQGKFSEAAAAYEQMLQSNKRSAAVYFNLGNAWFKAGQHGRAVAAYRQAQRLTPRDPNVRFNLQFVRKKISGDEKDSRSRWEQLFGNVTLNEWTVLAVTAYWSLFLLLASRELWPAARRTLRPYAMLAGVFTTVFAGFVGASAYMAGQVNDAVVVVPNAVVRRSPLEESAVSYQLPDGSEVTVLDTKESTAGGRTQVWLQVQGNRGIGWLQRDQVILLKAPAQPPQSAPETVTSTS
jgi:hypothetical protein